MKKNTKLRHLDLTPDILHCEQELLCAKEDLAAAAQAAATSALGAAREGR